MAEFGLTEKETIELRIKCLEPYVSTASKNGLMKDEVLLCAEKAWEYATKTLRDKEEAKP